MSKFLAIALAAPVLACPLVAPPALAQASQDTLADAIASALSNNPNLLAQRKANEAAGERLAQARAGGLPSVTLSGSYATQHTTQGLQFDVMGRRFPLSGDSQQAKAGLDARQSLYAGGAVTARTRQARAGVESADAQLAAYENEVILQVISAYLDVRRAESEVEIRESNVAALKTQVQAATDRFNVGDVTRTDVAQAQARESGAEAQLAAARSNLAAARANYEQIVGRPPVQLAEPPSLPVLPATLDEAVGVAKSSSPLLTAARAEERGAEQGAKAARGDLRPKIDLFGTASLQESYYDNSYRDTQVVGGVQLSIPIYQGGLLASRTRQAQLEADQAKFQRLAQERAVTAKVTAAWNQVIASKLAIEASQSQVSAAATALEGAQQELAVGTRTTLDVLDQEQELLAARLGLIDAERQSYLAAHQLLAEIGPLKP